MTWQRTDPEDPDGTETETVRTCAAHSLPEAWGWVRA